ncbi:hypothetical protein ACFOZ1_15315 [Gracilibacillus marinus]|uniref:Uncharacterized protein n=1 Tax=Gracilibacillus marinus TaxID=630535 RepID=A0ABV8VZU3_9BACI
MKTHKSRARLLAEEAAIVKEKAEQVKEKWTTRSDEDDSTS